MAEIVGVFAASHTPVMTNMPDAPETEHRDAAFAQFRRVGEEIDALQPDVLVLVSDDHLHNFFLDNFPAFCIGAAETYDSPMERWLKVERRTLTGHPGLGAHLLREVMGAGFDPAFSLELTLDHGMVTPLELAGGLGGRPIVPILVNAVQPPLPDMMRCIRFGEALGDAIRTYAGVDRVAVLATGGLSHDVGTPRMGMLNEAFDTGFLDRLAQGDPERLAAFCRDTVHEAGNGTEEVRNWLVAHGVAGCEGFRPYYYRAMSEWYTGIALGRWVQETAQ